MPDVFMPRLSDTMEEGTIAQWNVSEGDTVSRGDVLAEIETDKAVMDLEAYESGVLEKIIVQAGETVPIGEAIALIGDGSGSSGGSEGGSSGGSSAASSSDAAPESNGSAGQGDGSEEDTGAGETDSGGDAGDGSGTAAAEADSGGEGGSEDADGAERSDGSDGSGGEGAGRESEREAGSGGTDAPAKASGAGVGPLKASPVVRSLARTHSIDLSTVQGTGPGGRIIRVDVEKLIGGSKSRPESNEPAPAAKSATAGGGETGAEDQRVPLSKIRKVTAQRLSEAALVPAFQLTTVLDATKLGELRTQINGQLAESGVKISVTDLLVKACAVTLRAHPEVNAAFDGDAIIRRGHVNVGIAVALDDGLIVPVIRDADAKSLSQIGAEAKELAKKARAGKLAPAEFSGGTFTISNLGMFGIDSFTAVLNPPEAAILAVGSTVEEPVVVGGEVTVRPRTRLTLTVDHRVLDGAMGAAFLRDLTDVLTEPLRMLV